MLAMKGYVCATLFILQDSREETFQDVGRVDVKRTVNKNTGRSAKLYLQKRAESTSFVPNPAPRNAHNQS